MTSVECNNVVIPSHEEVLVPAADQLPSCQSSGGRWWCTCACPGTSPWPRPALPALSQAVTTEIWTIQMISVLCWSRKSQLFLDSSLETWGHLSSGRNILDKCCVLPSTCKNEMLHQYNENYNQQLWRGEILSVNFYITSIEAKYFCIFSLFAMYQIAELVLTFWQEPALFHGIKHFICKGFTIDQYWQIMTIGPNCSAMEWNTMMRMVKTWG